MIRSLCLALVLAAAGAADPTTYFNGDADYLAIINGLDYQSSDFLVQSSDSTAGAAAFWSISADELYLELAVVAKASGWLGFGLSENGGMLGADLMIFEARNPSKVMDAYVDTVRQPLMDDCQDWEFVQSSTDTDYLMVQVRRRLSTGDPQDRAIINDADLTVPTHRVIAAWGDDEQFRFHGQKRARGAIRWFGPGADEASNFRVAMEKQADGSFVIGADEYPVKAQDTEYAYFCFTADDLRSQGVPLDQGVTLIGFEPTITTQHVHHFIIYASTIENSTIVACDREMGGFFEMAYGWAPGDPPLALPENVGGDLGGESGHRAYLLEIHYDNPQLLTDSIDSSGVRFYYSNEARANIFGMTMIGDPFIALYGEPVGNGLMGHGFDCPSSCSNLYLDEPVTVVREWHHMHQSGTSTYLHHIRDGQIIRTAKAEYFDFDQQGSQLVVQESYQVQAGDSFSTKCYYQSRSGDEVFGLSSQQEMCIFFLLYYPKKMLDTPSGRLPWYCGLGSTSIGLEACDVAYNVSVLADDSELDRSFGTRASQCVASDSSASFPDSTTSMAVSNSRMAVARVAVAGLLVHFFNYV